LVRYRRPARWNFRWLHKEHHQRLESRRGTEAPRTPCGLLGLGSPPVSPELAGCHVPPADRRRLTARQHGKLAWSLGFNSDIAGATVEGDAVF
jgi:hypothetical protein